MAVIHFNNPQVRIKFLPARQKRRYIRFGCGKRQLFDETPVAIVVKGRAGCRSKEMKTPIKPVDDNENRARFGGPFGRNRAELSFGVAFAQQGLNPDF